MTLDLLGRCRRCLLFALAAALCLQQAAGAQPLEVQFSRSGGPVDAPLSIELTCPAAPASIHFTLDGGLPSAESPVYREPLVITNTTHVRARAYQDGSPGPTRSETYLVVHPTLRAFTSNLPALVIVPLGRDPQLPPFDAFAQLAFFEPVHGRTSLTNGLSLATRARYRVRGSSSMDMPKSSFVMHFVDESNQEEDRPVLGLPADSDWVLYAPNVYEPVMIHNPFVHQLSRDMGRYSPRTRFLEVYLARRSRPLSARDYQGIYVLEEKIKIGKHRVNLDELKESDLRPPEVTGGYLLKLDRLGPDESGFWAGSTSVVYVDPKERVINLPQRAPQRQFLASYFADFERTLHGPAWNDPELGYARFIDVDSWIDYHVLEVLSGNVDAMVFSTYFYKPRNGKLVFGPHWDFDRALGSTDGRDDNPRRWNTGRYFSTSWWAELFRDPDFWQRWVDRWQELRQEQFSLKHINGLIDRLANELREAQPREVKRWNLDPRGGSYQAEVDLMKAWLSNRIDFIDAQLVSKPVLTHAAGPVAPNSEVALTALPNAAIYYTLDGSDPRLRGGGISSNALAYSGPIRLTRDARLFARAHDPTKRQSRGPRTSTPWSGPVRATPATAP